MKNYGANYGLIYYGLGISLIIGPTISQVVKSKTGNYDYAHLIAFGLILSSAVLFGAATTQTSEASLKDRFKIGEFPVVRE